MIVHNKGFKANLDRAILINSYKVMTKDFNIPKKDRMDHAALARLSNEMLYKINKDLYSQATVKQAHKLAVKMGLLESPWSIFMGRLKNIFKWWRVIYSPQGAAHVKD